MNKFFQGYKATKNRKINARVNQSIIDVTLFVTASVLMFLFLGLTSLAS